MRFVLLTSGWQGEEEIFTRQLQWKRRKEGGGLMCHQSSEVEYHPPTFWTAPSSSSYPPKEKGGSTNGGRRNAVTTKIVCLVISPTRLSNRRSDVCTDVWCGHVPLPLSTLHLSATPPPPPPWTTRLIKSLFFLCLPIQDPLSLVFLINLLLRPSVFVRLFPPLIRSPPPGASTPSHKHGKERKRGRGLYGCVTWELDW